MDEEQKQETELLDEGLSMAPKRTPLQQMADDAVKVAVKQLETGAQYRTKRFDDIEKNEKMYAGDNPPALRGRSNIPFDSIVARGFVDTLMSKIDEALSMTFNRRREQDKKAAEKVTAAYEAESSPDRGAWSMTDLGVKKLAVFSGRGIYKKFADRDEGGFKDCLEPVDHWDFICEPQGGGWLDNHLFKGQMNIFRPFSDMRAKAKKGVYDERQVAKLVAATSKEDLKKNEDLYRHKVKRMSSFGVDFEQNNYVGSRLYRLVEWVMFFRGAWYYMIFNYEQGIWVRFEPLEKVFSVAKKKKGRGPWVSWPTHFDPFEFWSIAPMDSIRPVGYTMKKIVNLTLDNLEKRNWDMTAYDPSVFTEPRHLLYRQDGLVKATLKRGQVLANHIYKFQTPDTAGITIDLLTYLNAFLGEKTGITAASQGKADEDKVGIFFGNMQQVTDRLGLTNKMYQQAYVDLGVNFQWGLYDHAPEEYIVKLIGNAGVEWDEVLKRDEAKLDFTISVKGGNDETRANEILARRKQQTLLGIQKDPTLRQKVNPNWYLREWLSIGGYDQEAIRVAMDTQNDGDEGILAEAAQAIEDIVDGRKPKLNRGATTGFVQKIIDYAWDTEIDKRVFDALIAYAQAHIPVAQANMIRKMRGVLASLGADLTNVKVNPGAEEIASPGTRALPGGSRIELPEPEGLAGMAGAEGSEIMA